MRILVCLLSEQPVPNLLSVHHYRPDLLVLVETEQMAQKQCKEMFLEALALGGLRFSKKKVAVLFLEAEDSLATMEGCLARGACYWETDNAEILVNLTGGTKPMSLGAFRFFSEQRRRSSVRFLYTNARCPEVLLDLATGERETCTHDFSVREFFSAYGFGVKLCRGGKEMRSNWERYWPLAVVLASHAGPDKFLDMPPDRLGELTRKGGVLEANCIRPEKTQVRDALCIFFGECALSAAEWNFLKGGWLEVFFVGLLQHNKEALGISDVQMDISVRSIAKEAETEFDVAFMHRHTLHVVECKSGTQAIKDSNEPLDKLMSRRSHIRALRVHSVLASMSSKMFEGDGGNVLKEGARARSELYDIKILTWKEIALLAENTENINQVVSMLGLSFMS